MEATMSVVPPSVIPTQNKHLIQWVQKMADLCQPENVYWIVGSEEQNARLCQHLVEAGTSTKLSETK